MRTSVVTVGHRTSHLYQATCQTLSASGVTCNKTYIDKGLFNKENIVFKDGIGVQGLRFKLHGNQNSNHHGNYHCNHGNHHGLVSRD